jgi:hypothetical protein
VAGAEDMMLPVQRVEMDDDLDVSGERTSVACGAALLFPLGEPFTVVGRGAAAYLTAYGRPPSHTLRR